MKGSAGQKLAYVYFEHEPGRRSSAQLLSRDEARRIAANSRAAGFGHSLKHRRFARPVSAMGHERTKAGYGVTSALPPITDSRRTSQHVSFVPILLQKSATTRAWRLVRS